MAKKPLPFNHNELKFTLQLIRRGQISPVVIARMQTLLRHLIAETEPKKRKKPTKAAA